MHPTISCTSVSSIANTRTTCSWTTRTRSPPTGGDTWSQTERVTTAPSLSDASLFGANCTGEFIGDYTGIVADGATAHLLWMDGRPGTQPTSSSGDNDDQDAFHAEVTVG